MALHYSILSLSVSWLSSSSSVPLVHSAPNFHENTSHDLSAVPPSTSSAWDRGLFLKMPRRLVSTAFSGLLKSCLLQKPFLATLNCPTNIFYLLPFYTIFFLALIITYHKYFTFLSYCLSFPLEFKVPQGKSF